jgi:hypothetical protein
MVREDYEAGTADLGRISTILEKYMPGLALQVPYPDVASKNPLPVIGYANSSFETLIEGFLAPPAELITVENGGEYEYEMDNPYIDGVDMRKPHAWVLARRGNLNQIIAGYWDGPREFPAYLGIDLKVIAEVSKIASEKNYLSDDGKFDHLFRYLVNNDPNLPAYRLIRGGIFYDPRLDKQRGIWGQHRESTEPYPGDLAVFKSILEYYEHIPEHAGWEEGYFLETVISGANLHNKKDILKKELWDEISWIYWLNIVP